MRMQVTVNIDRPTGDTLDFAEVNITTEILMDTLHTALLKAGIDYIPDEKTLALVLANAHSRVRFIAD